MIMLHHGSTKLGISDGRLYIECFSTDTDTMGLGGHNGGTNTSRGMNFEKSIWIVEVVEKAGLQSTTEAQFDWLVDRLIDCVVWVGSQTEARN